MVGDPYILLSLRAGPVLYSIAWSSNVVVVLGFCTSKNVGEIVSISYPRTYAFPLERRYNAKSLEGVPPV